MGNGDKNIIRKNKKGIETSRKILQVSAALFAYEGYDSVSVRKIASAAGIKESSIYNHFSSKAAILEALFTAFSNNASKVWPEDEEIEKMIGFMKPDEIFKYILFKVSQFIDSAIANTVRIVLTERFRNEQAAALYYRTLINEPVDFYTTLIEKMIDKEIVKPVNARIMAQQYNHICVSLTMEYFMAQNGIGSVEEVINRMLGNVMFFYELMKKE
jgi:AcrR family transcriptional regulator